MLTFLNASWTYPQSRPSSRYKYTDTLMKIAMNNLSKEAALFGYFTQKEAVFCTPTTRTSLMTVWQRCIYGISRAKVPTWRQRAPRHCLSSSLPHLWQRLSHHRWPRLIRDKTNSSRVRTTWLNEQVVFIAIHNKVDLLQLKARRVETPMMFNIDWDIWIQVV